jgi:virulence-associated protein VagC
LFIFKDAEKEFKHKLKEINATFFKCESEEKLVIVCMDESGVNDSWHRTVKCFFDEFSAQFLVVNIELIDPKSLSNFEFDATRVHLIQSGNQIVLKGFKDSVGELVEKIEEFENEPIQEELEHLKEFEIKLLLMVNQMREKNDILDVEIDAKNGMVKFNGPRALVKKGKKNFFKT